MGASQATAKADRAISVALNDTLTSGITKFDASKRISEQISLSVFNREVTLWLRVNALYKNIAADAALAFGENVFTYPAGLGLVEPIFTTINLQSLTPTGLSATAGEVGLGTTIASGAVANLHGTAGFQNVMEGTTLANHVAGTALTNKVGNSPIAFGDHGAAGSFAVINASAAAQKVYLNLASTWDQTAAENVRFAATIVHRFRVLSSDYGSL